jgi:hypothetical protein
MFGRPSAQTKLPPRRLDAPQLGTAKSTGAAKRLNLSGMTVGRISIENGQDFGLGGHDLVV